MAKEQVEDSLKSALEDISELERKMTELNEQVMSSGASKQTHAEVLAQKQKLEESLAENLDTISKHQAEGLCGVVFGRHIYSHICHRLRDQIQLQINRPRIVDVRIEGECERVIGAIRIP